jgi:hypothetical protein
LGQQDGFILEGARVKNEAKFYQDFIQAKKT